MAGILMAISFLTRYFGFILPIVYLLYPLVRAKTRKLMKDKYYWSGLILSLIILTPWFVHNQINFNSPVGALLVETGTITGEWYRGEWYFYFARWIEAFGLVGFFIIPAIISLSIKPKNSGNLLIVSLTVISILFFILIPRKELRYLLHYFSVYMILISIGIVEFRKWFKSKRWVPFIVIFFSMLNLIGGIQLIVADSLGGSSLKEAGLYINNVAPEGTRIMSQNMPVLYYTASREIVYFPENETDLMNKISENNVSFIVIESREPTYPDYVWIMENWEKKPSAFWDNFTLEKTFEENNKTYVWIYKA